MKKRLGIILASVVAVFCLIGSVYSFKPQIAEATEIPQITVENSGDTFVLADKNFDKQESFVYSSDVYFEHGQAGALVFGASDEAGSRRYWVFNVDRFENKVKLIYFYDNAEGNIVPTELLVDWYVGNDKMNDGEKQLVGARVREIDKVHLKVVITVEGDKVYGEFYADGIRRFGVDNVYDINEFENLPENVSYEGGYLGYNCFNAKVRFEKTHYGESDYTYYTEVYRQQYHFSQFAHWNNDPNGLVYYKGYYHIYYQHNPYSIYWGDMYWGHARSTDLVHWELLPICLFPDTEGEFGPGNGYMWSGSAMVYRKGMSEDIDARGWFPNGNGEGLIAFYTRDGGLQDQVLMTSDDEGMTWTKRVRIPQDIVVGPGKTDCRDPKVFPVKKDENGKVTLWGMAVTGMATGNIWFMKSTNLIDWTSAGGFKGYTIDVNRDFRSECPDLVVLKADDNTTHAVLTLTARTYLVGSVAYDEESGHIKFLDVKGRDISALPLEEIPYQKMDYGPDSYATQTFYIDDESSEYYGKTVGISWFSGVPGGAASIESGALHVLRMPWNGGGVTIPTVWGLAKDGDGYKLTQSPIVKTNEAFDKKQVVSVSDTTVKKESENLLKDVASKTVELSATISNPSEEKVYFRIQSSGKEYTEIGWSKEDGYYVDRTNTYDGGLSMPNYHVKYKSGAVDGKNLDFYILADNGSVEVFCKGGTIPFYVLTFAAPYSVGASFHTTGDVLVKNLFVNEIGTVWRDESVKTDETVLYISQDSVELSKNLSEKKEVTVYSTAGGEITWSVEEGEDVVSVTPTNKGGIIEELKAGTATVLVQCGNAQKRISVTVYEGEFDCDIDFTSDGILSGDWLMTENGIIGKQSAGDGFILSNTRGVDFTYTAKFNLGDGVAAAIVFRAEEDMSDYYIANYDNNGKIVKLWTPYGELANVHVGQIDVSNITITATVKDNHIEIYLNGNKVVDVTDTRENAPQEGYFGLNVCATRATFTAIGLQENSYTYNLGDLTIKSSIEQAVTAIYNDTLGTQEISRDFYSVEGRKVIISESYFKTLSKTGVYEFTVKGKSTTFSVKVNVIKLPEIELQDLTLQEGTNAVFFIGNENITSVSVKGQLLTQDKYSVKDGVIIIDSSAFSLGENLVVLSGRLKIKVIIEPLGGTEEPEESTSIESTPSKPSKKGCGASVGSLGLLPLMLATCAIIRGKKYGNDD